MPLSKNLARSLISWFDSKYLGVSSKPSLTIAIRSVPFVLTHLLCFGVFFVGFSYTALTIALISYLVRMFAITAFYHRYFSHRSFKTSRAVQLIFAVAGMAAAQRGPLWWSSHHRKHHKYSDQENDVHSPFQHGFFKSHFSWFFSSTNFETDDTFITDLNGYPELRFLNRFDSFIPIFYGLFLYILGAALQYYGFKTTGAQALIWGYFVSTVLLYHATFSINSIAHVYGKRNFETKDHSKNNFILSLITLGEGWHNNHHFWPSSARHGLMLKEIDITFYILKLMEKCRLISDLRLPPTDIINEARIY